jgi:hypothetical protein
MDPKNRRAFPRYPAQGRGTITRQGPVLAPPASGAIFDISAGGVCIRLQDPPEVDEQVALELDNPLRHARVRVAGRVAHVTPENNGWYRVGCCFHPGRLDIHSW